MKHMTRMISVAAGLMLLAGCNGGVETPPPSPGPSSVTTPGGSPSPAPSPSPTSEEDVAVAEAIAAYRNFNHAMHVMGQEGGSPESLDQLLKLVTSEGPMRDAAMELAQVMRESDLRSTGQAKILRATPTEVDLAERRISLATCLDLREVVTTGGSEETPDFMVEWPELRFENGRWLVFDAPGEESEC